VWAVFYADNRMREVLSAEDYATSNLLSRIYVYGGHAERMLGEMYCDLVYNYGKDGGVLLGDQSIYDAGNLVPNDSAFKRAIWMYERALELAEAGVSAGVTAPADETPGRPIFEADHLVTASHAGLAQAYANLGDWNNAVQHARMGPDGWADWSLMDSEVDGGNDMADFFFENDDMNMYRTPIAMKWFDDPRAQIVKCGDWAGPNLDDSPSTPPASAFINMSAACGVISGEYRSESNRYPLWITTKYEDDSADIEVASGAEMRLIEAEAALVQGNLGEFTAQVNRARAVYGATPISQPATAGAIEFPNDEDDAWSILDRERLLELFGEARRAWDLRRWEHPFVTDNHVLVPRHVEELGPQGRFICIPVPDQEGDTNPVIDCPNLASGSSGTDGLGLDAVMSPSPSATAFSALLAFLDLDLENAEAALVVLNPDRSEARVVRAECRGGGFRRAKGDGSGRRPLQVAEAGIARMRGGCGERNADLDGRGRDSEADDRRAIRRDRRCRVDAVRGGHERDGRQRHATPYAPVCGPVALTGSGRFSLHWSSILLSCYADRMLSSFNVCGAHCHTGGDGRGSRGVTHVLVRGMNGVARKRERRRPARSAAPPPRMSDPVSFLVAGVAPPGLP
jgi:hypothetical protein